MAVDSWSLLICFKFLKSRFQIWKAVTYFAFYREIKFYFQGLWKKMKPVIEANIYDASPEFRKIFFPDQSSHHLKIPPTFNKKLKGVFPSECILESRGKTWCITVKEVNDNLFYLENGWPKFVQDNALTYGDFLVFSYIGNSKFHVSIWDKNGSRKKNPNTKTCQTTKLSNTFQVTFRPAYVSYVNVPRELGKQLNKYTKCTLKIAKDLWVVNLIGHESDRLRFGGGLRQFLKDNKVKVGDLLTFQLISKHENAFTVDISRR